MFSKWSNLHIFIVISLVTIFLSYIIALSLGLEKMTISSLSDQLTAEQIKRVIFIRDRWQWVQYAFIPIFLLIKVSIVALLIDMGCLFHSEEIPYKQLFRMALLGEVIFLAVPILKFCWFYFVKTDFTLEDFQYFYPLSFTNITGHKGVSAWLLYPFQVINVFELLYFIFLSIQVDKAIGSTTEKGLTIVATGYGTGLLLWILAVMFFVLNMTV